MAGGRLDPYAGDMGAPPPLTTTELGLDHLTPGELAARGDWDTEPPPTPEEMAEGRRIQAMQFAVDYCAGHDEDLIEVARRVAEFLKDG